MKKRESFVIGKKERSSSVASTNTPFEHSSQQIRSQIRRNAFVRQKNGYIDQTMKKEESMDEKMCSSLPSLADPINQNCGPNEQNRRNAFISRKMSFKSSNSVERQKITRAKMMRRNAITNYMDEFPVHVKKAKSGAIDRDDVGKQETLRLGKHSVNNEWLIVLKPDGDLNVRYKGSTNFLSLINMHYIENYQFSDSDTHRSVILATILHEMKGLGYIMIRESDSGEAVILDDDRALQVIKGRIDEVHCAYTMLF